MSTPTYGEDRCECGLRRYCNCGGVGATLIKSNDALRSLVEELAGALFDIKEAYAGEVEGRYESTKHHPAMKARLERDLAEVRDAEATLSRVREAGIEVPGDG